MQKKLLFTGTSSEDRNTGFFTDIYIQNVDAHKEKLFSAIVCPYQNFDVAIPEKLAKSINYDMKSKGKACEYEIGGKILKVKKFFDKELMCHIPIVDTDGKIWDGRSSASVILIYKGDPPSELYRDKIVIGYPLLGPLEIYAKPHNQLFRLEVLDDAFLIPWEVTSHDQLKYQIKPDKQENHEPIELVILK